MKKRSVVRKDGGAEDAQRFAKTCGTTAWALSSMVLVLVAVCLHSPSIAQTHRYLNESTGDDVNNDGQTATTAWKTIAKLNAVYAGGLPSNTVVHLARGGKYYGQVNVSGSATNVSVLAEPLTGTSDRPILSGSDFVPQANWVLTGIDQWRAPIPNALTEYYLYDGA